MTANQFILCPMCGKQMTDSYFTWWQYDDGIKERLAVCFRCNYLHQRLVRNP